jgi:allantoinase
VVHASSPGAVDAARRWPLVTVETCPHYLLLDDCAGPLGRCNPPVRDATAREEMWARVADGRIDWISSDHSPCGPERRGNWAGIDGVGLTLPLLLSTGRLPLADIVRLTTQAARALRLPGKGAVVPGFDADLALVDPTEGWEIGPNTTWSRHRMSAFAGTVVKGRVVMTLVRGRIVFTSADGPSPGGGGVVLRPRLS